MPGAALARWLLIAVGVVTFLAAAKAHGRQLRLERELAGHWNVTFGGQNPPFVEALWARERVLYWSVAAGLLALSLALRWLGRGGAGRLGELAGSWSGAAVLHGLAPLIGAFVVTGLLSLLRLLRAAPAAAPPSGWWTTSSWGTGGWWGLTLLLLGLMGCLAWVATAEVARS